jgi:hypothetical protein
MVEAGGRDRCFAADIGDFSFLKQMIIDTNAIP